MGKRSDRQKAKQVALSKEAQRRFLRGNGQPGPRGLGIRLPPQGLPGAPAEKPDFSEVKWGELHPNDAHRLKRAMMLAHIGLRAKEANDFLQWGLRPHPIEPESRLARDDKAVTLGDETNLVSSTARYPSMNASENLVAAAQVVAFAVTKGQLRTSAVSVLCRTAMESAAKTIWLIGDVDPEERRRRCLGFIEDEWKWQNHFDEIEKSTLALRTDELVETDRAEFETHREKFEKRRTLVTDLPKEDRRTPPKFTKLVNDAADWVDANRPRQPDPELDKVMHPRGAKSFYSLGSSFVHGLKWAIDYVEFGDDSDLIEMTLDAFGAALRMTECAVILFEAQSLGLKPNPARTRIYPAGLEETVKEWAERYR
ncbi:hypothetical protein MMUR_22230 [Mycolicibacterium murale]|uniref:Uncharacterized protein n=1 Tax=Mycolicibacterium murale TaxID=182220 RepID=A0A7I9WLI8_9MYCO|nr:hypothetical protein [Mycolicibacterium murale]MCV7185575.1 hypothetical protein [Mycolicibacterium murale]GFG58087.1 hypothetical protein MMUR_22230 [Mycolicibacterium murale]